VNKGKRKGGHIVLLNFYPPSSRCASGAGQYWIREQSDGGHLQLNALVHAATFAQHKRRKANEAKKFGAALADVFGFN